MTKLSLIFVCPPTESRVKLPDAVLIVFEAEPTVTPFAENCPEPTDNIFVLGCSVTPESAETATPEPPSLFVNNK